MHRCRTYRSVLPWVALLCLTSVAGGRAADFDPETGTCRSRTHELDLAFLGGPTAFVKDAGAADGECARMENAPRGAWFIQWPWDLRYVVPGVPYALSIRVRVDKRGGTGDAFTVGIYDRGEKKALVPARVIPAREVGAEWREIPVGVFEPGGRLGTLYLSASGNAEIPRVYLDWCRLVPQASDALAAGLARIRDEEQRRRDLEARFRPAPAPRLEQLFIFGACSAQQEMRVHAELFGTTWQFLWRERIDDLLRHSCNLAFDLSTDAHTPALPEMARIAQEEGIYFVGGQSHVIPGGRNSPRTTIDADRVRRQFQALAPQFAGLDRFLFWYLVDEPRYDQAHAFLEGKEVIESVDRERPAVPLMNTQETIRTLGPHQQVLITDRYPTYRQRSDPWCIGDWVRQARESARGPVWLMYPAYSSTGMRMSTPAEARVMIYQALAAGAAGIVAYIHAYVAHWERKDHPETLIDPFGTPNATWEAIGAVGRDLAAVGPLLARSRLLPGAVGVESERTIHAAGVQRPAVEGGLWEDGRGCRYLVLVNNDLAAPRRARITWPAATRVLDLFTLRRVEAPDTVTLGPAEGRILAAGPAPALAAVEREVRSHRYAAARVLLDRDAAHLARCRVDVAPARRALAEAGTQAGVGAWAKAEALVGEARRRLEGAAKGAKEYQPVRDALDAAREGLSRRHAALVAAGGAGESDRVAAVRAELLPLGKRYFALRERFVAGETRSILVGAEALARDAGVPPTRR